MKRLLIIFVGLLALTSCGNSVKPNPVDSAADKWQSVCQSLPNSNSCHDAADKVRDQGTIYGYDIGGRTFRVSSSDAVSDICAVENPPKSCGAELMAHNGLGLYGLYCQDDTGIGSICFAKLLIRNITSGVLTLRLKAKLYDADWKVFEPNVSGETKYRSYIPLNFETEFAKKLNPGQAEYWDVGFKVSGQLDGYTHIALDRIGPYEHDSLRLIPVPTQETGFRYYEEAWYTNVKYSRTLKTDWQPTFTRFKASNQN